MRKHLITAVLAAACACIMAVPAFAGVWLQDNAGNWHYDYYGRGVEEGFARNQWLKVDGSWYFFDADGYMETKAIRNGYYLGADGRWA